MDGELESGARATIDAHLSSCPACCQVARTEQSASTILRSRAAALKEQPIPPGLRSRCEVALAAERRPRTARGWLPRLVPVALVLLLVGATGSALFAVATERSETLLAAQLTLDHLKCFRYFATGSTMTADPKLVQAMLHDRYGWDLQVPGGNGADTVSLDGVRRCLYAEGPVPHVMYQAHGQNVSLFVLDGTTRPRADVTTFGHRARIWSRGNTTYVLVASADADPTASVVGVVDREVH